MKKIQNITNTAPPQRLGEPSDISEVIVFLAGPARWINSQVYLK